MTTPQIPQDFEQMVAQYVKLRDALKVADDKHKERTKVARDHLNAMGGALLDKLNAVGGDSVKTGSGTVYRTTRRSATIADGEVFRRFVIDNGAYDIVDWKANANAVEDFVKSKGSLPPGVNFSTAFTVGVRRS